MKKAPFSRGQKRSKRGANISDFTMNYERVSPNKKAAEMAFLRGFKQYRTFYEYLSKRNFFIIPWLAREPQKNNHSIDSCIYVIIRTTIEIKDLSCQKG